MTGTIIGITYLALTVGHILFFIWLHVREPRGPNSQTVVLCVGVGCLGFASFFWPFYWMFVGICWLIAPVFGARR